VILNNLDAQQPVYRSQICKRIVIMKVLLIIGDERGRTSCKHAIIYMHCQKQYIRSNTCDECRIGMRDFEVKKMKGSGESFIPVVTCLFESV